MKKKSLAKKMILLVGCANLWMAPLPASAMEIIFDKNYNISRNANITTLNWKTVSFTKISGGRIKYHLVAEHPEGKGIEYLQNADSLVSEEIKKRLIRKFDIVTSDIKFQDGQAHLELELPYDFETRYLPIKVMKQDGYEDYVVRFRFGDYRFLVANKLINRAAQKDVSNIASKDHNELFNVRTQAKKRVIIKKKEDAPVFTVDDIYADAQETLGSRAIAESAPAAGGANAATVTKKPATKTESSGSLFDQFESLTQQYGTDVIDTDKKPEVADNQVKEEEASLAESLPQKTETAIESLVSVDSMLFDEPVIMNTGSDEVEVVELDEELHLQPQSEKAASEVVLDTPSWIDSDKPAKEQQLVEQKIDEIKKEEESYESYEGTLFEKFETAVSNYNAKIEKIHSDNKAEVEAMNAAAIHDDVAAAEEALMDDLEAQEDAITIVDESSVDEELETSSEFLIYQTVETSEDEDLAGESLVEVASVVDPFAESAKETYTEVPDDGSIPWLETSPSVSVEDKKSPSTGRGVSSEATSRSQYDVAPQEWVFSFRKGFTFKSTISKDTEDSSEEKRKPDSSNKSDSLEDYDTGVSFEDEELGSSYKKKD